MKRSSWMSSLLLVTFTAYFLLLEAGCGSSNTPPPKRFRLQGEVLATDVPGKTIYVKHGDIPGFMGAMSMGYPIADSQEIAALRTGDKIQAEVVVEGGQGRLEKIVVLKEAESVTPAKQ